MQVLHFLGTVKGLQLSSFMALQSSDIPQPRSLQTITPVVFQVVGASPSFRIHFPDRDPEGQRPAKRFRLFTQASPWFFWGASNA